MEVHSHSHTPRKKWTHYFWEFLMLFLAVFCGFLAENQREHYIEHSREKQFINTLIEDLKSDTIQLSANIMGRDQREKMIDSLVVILNSPDSKDHGSDIYYFGYNALRPARFLPNDRTILQLKNAGNMRLIRKLSVSDSIMAYDQETRRLQEIIIDEREIRTQFREFTKKLFDGNTLFSILDRTKPGKFSRPPGNPALISWDPAIINEFIVTLQMTQHVMRVGRTTEERLKRSATELILFLKNEYGVK